MLNVNAHLVFFCTICLHINVNGSVWHSHSSEFYLSTWLMYDSIFANRRSAPDLGGLKWVLLCKNWKLTLTSNTCAKKRCGNSVGTLFPFPHQIKRKASLHQIVWIKWAFACKNFYPGPSCFTVEFWLAVQICVSLAHLWDRSHVLM